MYAFAREPSKTLGNLHSKNYKIVPTGVILKRTISLLWVKTINTKQNVQININMMHRASNAPREGTHALFRCCLVFIISIYFLICFVFMVLPYIMRVCRSQIIFLRLSSYVAKGRVLFSSLIYGGKDAIWNSPVYSNLSYLEVLGPSLLDVGLHGRDLNTAMLPSKQCILKSPLS